METDRPPSKTRRHIGWMGWFFAAFLVWSAWGSWRQYDLRKAKEEARALGWQLDYTDPVERIKADWRNVFESDTWNGGKRFVLIRGKSSPEPVKRILPRLKPRIVIANDVGEFHDLTPFQSLSALEGLKIYFCRQITSLDGLKNLPALQELELYVCPILTDVDALKSLPSLKNLTLLSCAPLTDITALKSLRALESLILAGCPRLTSLDALSGLASLKELTLNGCPGLTNVDALKSLPSLKTIRLGGCTGLPGAIDALRAALPDATITDP